MDATSRRSSEATFKWSGRGGVVKKFLDHTTPSARTNEASRLFLIVRPTLMALLLLRRGVRPGTHILSWFALKPHLKTTTSIGSTIGPGRFSARTAAMPASNSLSSILIRTESALNASLSA